MTVEEQRYQSRCQLQVNQAQSPQQAQPQEQKPLFHKPFSDGDFEFVSSNIRNHIFHSVLQCLTCLRLKNISKILYDNAI